MAAYRTKVTLMSNGKEYRPGSILPADISSAERKEVRRTGRRAGSRYR